MQHAHPSTPKGAFAPELFARLEGLRHGAPRVLACIETRFGRAAMISAASLLAEKYIDDTQATDTTLLALDARLRVIHAPYAECVGFGDWDLLPAAVRDEAEVLETAVSQRWRELKAEYFAKIGQESLAKMILEEPATFDDIAKVGWNILWAKQAG